MMDFTYSIVVPHYNSHDELDRLFESIPARADIQIIVVDDNSREAIDVSGFTDKHHRHHIEFYVNDTGVDGAGSARNIALSHVRGQYTLFADADDFFCDGAFELLDTILQGDDISYFSPTAQCDVTGGDSDRHHLYANLVNDYLSVGDEEIRYHFSVPWSKVYLTEFLEDHALYFDDVIASNDVMFSLVSGHKAKRIAAYQNEIYCVTRGKGTLTVNFEPEVVRSRYLVEIARADYIAKFDITTEKPSFYKMVKNFHKVMSLGEFAYVLGLLLQRKITVVPRRTYYYLKNPFEAFSRVINRKSSESSQRYQA
ncbi:glycosyltransferase family 2 protein [Vibrio renipiscarius]|nr:glycosyltransferase [Vibrio renipiscarius]